MMKEKASFNNDETERRAILVSMFSALFFSILGFVFSIWSSSQAVLLDGAFNLISAVTIGFGFKISKLLNAPISFKRPAGYVALEPLYIIIKGFIVFGLTAFVVVSNVILLLDGGNELKLGVIVIYILIALVGNILTYLYIRAKNKQVDSSLLQVETENWMINTVITGSIAVSFVIAFFFKDGFLSDYVKYVDQIIVIAVGILTIFIPIKAMLMGTRELLLIGQDDTSQKEIEDKIDEAMRGESITKRNVYVLKTGRKRWITIYLQPSGRTIPIDFSDLIKGKCERLLSESISNVDLEVIITKRD